MSEVLFSLALLACTVGMGLMMWFMMRGRKDAPPSSPPPATADAEVVRLRSEVDQLHAAQRDAGNLKAPSTESGSR